MCLIIFFAPKQFFEKIITEGSRELIVLNPFLDSLCNSALKNTGLAPGIQKTCFQHPQDVVIILIKRIFQSAIQKLSMSTPRVPSCRWNKLHNNLLPKNCVQLQWYILKTSRIHYVASLGQNIPNFVIQCSRTKKKITN